MPDDAIRKARPADVPAIHRLIDAASKDQPVIPRTHFEIYASLRDFLVYDDGRGAQGCVALHITWHDLAEVRSLVVDAALRGRGIGKRLTLAAVEEAKSLGLARVFALTNVADFFRKLGFVETDRHELPQKIWKDCVACPRFPDCDETAVLYLTGVKGDGASDLPDLD
jgi:amino-acid N-acetyltransferase